MGNVIYLLLQHRALDEKRGAENDEEAKKLQVPVQACRLNPTPQTLNPELVSWVWVLVVYSSSSHVCVEHLDLRSHPRDPLHPHSCVVLKPVHISSALVVTFLLLKSRRWHVQKV